ncbi:YDG domain-containing protein [Luteibacter sp. 329MFSha]|uniref:YDG domain-containing protein n=1 Tax=Luteibacter sp. 329MFSha TaxID=1798239 RepID=UPI0008CCFDE2|nr:YDG domain-containing protein [Luteibacter sp. 329MFSha]SEV92763.1 filamentous hemagglutinin family N-terminal domain-containing protein [Luteibacter sp. 329MFSha]
MNRIYRLCWNAATSQWVAASELARSSRPVPSTAARARAPRAASVAVAISLALGAPGLSHAGQTGGQIVGGNGSIQQGGAVTTIRQDSQRLSLNWQTFDIGANETVKFVQPGRDAIAVNRILGNKASDIQGHLDANGQVWLINPNGVVFGERAQVNVGGLVASTLDTGDDSVDARSRTFSGDGKGAVINKGAIHAADGGYVALLGNQVSNQGVVTARLGTVAMAGGSAVTLNFEGSQLVNVQVDRSTLDNLVENRQLVQADGGRVFMTAGARDSLLASAVNNTGVVRAQTVENRDGQIVLLGGMTAGHVNVEGTLDASAPNGGNGGHIETSAAFANLGAAHVTAAAPRGAAGTWLIDPYDLTIDQTAATTISNSLNGGTNVTEQTTAGGTQGVGVINANGSGDITVAAPITWTNAAATLTLDAYRSINVNAAIGGPGRVTLKAGSGGTGDIVLGAAIRGDSGVTLTAAGHFVNQAGAGALAAANGRWLVYSSSPVGDTTGGLVPGFLQYNAPAGTAPVVGGNGFLYALAPTIALGAPVGTVRKDYDGGTAAALTGANFNASGLVNGDRIATGSGTYASKDAASGLQVTTATAASAYTFTAADGMTPVYGYGVSGGGASANIGVIDPKQLGIAIVNNPTKTYNGTTTATLTGSNYLMSGLVAGESITFSQPNTVAYDAADAGARTVTATFVPSNFVAANNTKVSNYVLPTVATGVGTINKAKVQLSGLIGNDKVYDGTANDSLDKSRASIFGVIAADVNDATLDASAGAGLFADANVGNGKGVTATGFQLVGSKASNYELVTQSDITASITPKTLTIGGVSALNKVYDATTGALLAFDPGTYGLQGVVGSDAVALLSTGASASFATKNVGNGLTVTATGFALSGNGAGNYRLAQPTGLSANITPAPLTLTITGNPTRTYNGTVNANLRAGDVTIQGWKGSDTGSVVQSAGASYDSKDAGTRTVTAAIEASDFNIGSGTSLSNYTFASSITGLGTIAKAPLQWKIVGNPSKQYDGTTNATLTGANYDVYGFIVGEGASVTQTRGDYATADAGIRLVTATVGAGDFAPIAGTNLANYVLPTSITGYGYIEKADTGGVLVRIIGVPTRAYDGTTLATLLSSDYQVTGNFPSGEGFVITKTQGTYASKNVGKQPVMVTLDQGDYQPVGNTNPDNYKPLPTEAYGTGEITRAILTASIVGNPSKVYDGTTYQTLDVSNYDVSGFASGEGADIVPSKSVHYDTKNVGTNKTITADMAVTSYLAHSGTDLSNYQLDFDATGTGSITAAPLHIVGVSANGKVYDTTTAATLNSAGARLIGLVGADVSNVTLTRGTTGTFDSADAGTRGVTAIGFGISGSEAGNYTLDPLTGLSATISPAALNILNVAAVSRYYNGNTAIALNTSGASLSGVFDSDAGNVVLDASSATGSVRSPNAANGLDVTTTGFGLTGSRASNYRVNAVTGLQANINKAPIVATITGNPTKPYDGSNSVTLLAGDYTLTGFVNGQGATIPQSSTSRYLGVNAGSNVGLASTLSVSDFVANAGTNLANYALPTAASGTLGTITPFIINLTSTRVYDATTNAAASLFTDGNGTVLGVNGERVSLTGTGTLVTKNVGSQRAFQDFGTLALGNYGGSSAQNYTLAGGIDWVTITPATLTVSGTFADDKVYDGNRTATLHGALLNGVLGADTVNLNGTGTGTFDSKNVGTGKAVATAMTIDGTDAMNYVLRQPTDVTASITQKHVTVSATGITRVYDGTTGASATQLSVDGKVGNDAVTAGGTKTFDTKDVGTGKTISVSQIALSGTDAGNYALDNATTSTTGNITARVINLSGGRIYDQTQVAAAGTLAMSNLVGGETLVLSGAGALGGKNVGAYAASKTGALAFALGTLALGDGGNGGKASNYTLVGGTDTYNVTRAPLTVNGTVAANKIYDGNTAASLSGSVLVGAYGGDDIGLGNTAIGAFSDKNVGQGKTVTTSFTLLGNDAGNYALTQPGNVRADITAKGITVVATGVNKVYDGTTSSTATLGSADVANGDQVSYTWTSNLFADKNVANGIGVLVGGIGLTGTGAGNYTLLNTQASTTANITPYVLSLQGTRVYDATALAAANVFGGSVNGVNGEVLGLSGSVALADKNVGAQKTPTDISGMSLVDIGNGLTGNYSLQGGTHWVTITPRNITGSITAGDKVYDGNTTTIAYGVLSGVLANDDVGYAWTLGNFDTKNAGNGKTVTVSGQVGGADAANYIVTSNATTLANVTPKAITGTILADDRVYDRTTGATTHGALSGVIGIDDVRYTSTSGQFLDKNAGYGKTVVVVGVVGGADKDNYVVTSNGTTLASIAAKAITVANTSTNKVYDTTNAASTSLSQTGVIAGDDVVLGATGSTFADANAATGKTVTTTGIGLGGADAANYTANTTATTLADITPYVLDLQGTRVYDGSNVIAASVLGGSIAGIGGQVLGLTGAMQVADKNVGTRKPATDVSGMSLVDQGGALASNYTFFGGDHWATITPKAIVVDATGSNKVYDGNTIAQASLGSAGIVGNDQVTFTGSQANYSDRNAGTGKTIVVQGITAAGGDVGNYTWNTTAQTLGDITPKAIVGSIVADGKTYDGTTAATTHGTLAGVVTGDDVSVGTQGVFVDRNAGTGKTVNVGGTLGGGDAGNYALSTNATTLADIGRVVISLDGTRVYDGTAAAAAAMFGQDGLVAGIAGETLRLSGTGALASRNVATRETVAGIGTLALNDNGGALAVNYTLLGGTHVATVTPLLVRAGVSADDKVYDGSTSATTHGALSGVLAGDDVRLTTSGRFLDKNAGQGKTVAVDGRIDGVDAGNYRLDVAPTTLASITKRAVTISATGTNKFFDGNANDVAPLSVSGVLSGDVVTFAASSTLFSDSAIGLGKTVTASGIQASGADAQNYAYNTVAVTSADILQNPSQGASSTAVAQMDAVLAPESIATPYGVAQNLSVGQYSGNHKKTRKAVEKNVSRSDFTSGLSLRLVDGGVRAPADAMQ